MRAAAVALLFVLLAGCSNGGKASDEGGEEAAPEGDRGGTSPEGAASANATQAAPVWSVGQAWSWNLHSAIIAGEDPEDLQAETVVLGVEGTIYDIGTTTTTDALLAYPFHLIGFGPVDASNLAWLAHGSPVQFLRFPLVDGDRFTADFWGAPGAEVMVRATNVTGPDGLEPGFQSTVTTAGGGGTFIQADYATARGQFVRVATYFGGDEPFAEATLVGEGSGKTGTPFRPTDLVRWNAHADAPDTLAPRQFNVPAGPDTMLVACFISGGPGQFAANEAQAGGSTGCSAPGNGATVYAWAYTSALEGPGTVQATPGGMGAMTVELFAIDTEE